MADLKAGADAGRFNPLDYPQCLDLPKRFKALPWHEHIPFMKVLVQMLRPKVFVKLGIHSGSSYFAVCETAAALGVSCYGVDGKSVKHVGVADEKAVKSLHAYNDSHFGNFSRLMHGEAGEAAAHFAPGSVDLLHIDNQHSYEGVCRDWETWRPKLSRSAVVVFHHTNVRENDFGVWKLWKELRPTYRSFEFLHGAGLGVLVAGQTIPESLSQLLTWAEKHPDPVRKYFFALGGRLNQLAQSDTDRETIADLEKRLAAADTAAKSQAEEWQTHLNAHAAEVERLEAQTAALDQSLRARSDEAEKLAPLCVQRQTQIAALSAQLAETQPLRERVEKLEADAARLRAANEKLKNSMSYRWGRTLTAPLRMFTGKE